MPLALAAFQQRTSVTSPSAPLLHDLGGLLEVRLRALLRADLDDAVVLARRLHHRAAFGDGHRRRLLDVDVLAGLAGEHRHQRVPVIGRADDDGVDGLVVEDAPEVGVPGGGRRDFGGLGQVGRVDVADGGDLDVGEALMAAQHAGALPAGADDADADAIVGAERRGPGEAVVWTRGAADEAGRAVGADDTYGAGEEVATGWHALLYDRRSQLGGSRT